MIMEEADREAAENEMEEDSTTTTTTTKIPNRFKRQAQRDLEKQSISLEMLTSGGSRNIKYWHPFKAIVKSAVTPKDKRPLLVLGDYSGANKHKGFKCYCATQLKPLFKEGKIVRGLFSYFIILLFYNLFLFYFEILKLNGLNDIMVYVCLFD